ncbi:transcriptional regulator [Prauserella muralis]|uniref:Transcriptional regulator n=1 Tax=Prauserella muralis TaxID=588067 RepID=A0A2V4BBV1_9PSEU|nr:transcriptional regulator [Prauserella muralis]
MARALNLVGERWALLVVRELLFGPKRFTDLRAGLPAASQNVLSTRLRELEEAGIVARRRLGPPASTWVYELTELGRGLEPVLLSLATWGSRLPRPEGSELSLDALMLALRTTFDPERAGQLRVLCELRLGEDTFHARVADGAFRVSRDASGRPDAVIETTAPALRALVFGGARLTAAVRRGDVRVEGDRMAAERFLGLFPRPATLAR